MPHVTEEIWSFMPGERGLLAVSPWPEADDSLLDAEAEAEMERVREIVTVIRRLRDEAGIKPGVKLLASSDLDGALSEHVANLARLDLSGNGGDPVATVGGGAVRILASGDLDAGVFQERIVARRAKLADEVARIEKKLSNDGFVAKAPPEVVQEERDKLVTYRRELESLQG
jgi:valyl-tRNA synthetase